MKKINDEFCGYLKVEEDVYSYNVSKNIVTLLPAESDSQKRNDCIRRLRLHNIDSPEYLLGEDGNSRIAILRNGKFATGSLGINTSAKFATPIIIKACGNAQGFFGMMTEPWERFHAITFYGGNINALCNPGIAIVPPDFTKELKFDGAREIRMYPWSEYTKEIEFVIEGEKITLTFSIGQSSEDNAENKGAYNLGRLESFIRLSFEHGQEFATIEKYYVLVRTLVAILTFQNNVCFEEIYLSQRNSEQQFFKTGICKIFDHYENYSIRNCYKVIQIFDVWDYIPKLIDEIIKGKTDYLL